MTKLYFRICTLFVLFIFTGLCQAQKLSTEVRKDFCQNALLNYWYGSDTFRYVMVQAVRSTGTVDYQQIEIKIENICNDTSLQEEVFRLINSIGGTDDYKFAQFHSLGMTASNAKTLTDYVLSKYNSTLINQNKDETNKGQVSRHAEFVGGYSNRISYIKNNVNYSILENYVFNQNGKHLLKDKNLHDKYINLKIELKIELDGSVKLRNIEQEVSEEVFNEIKRVMEGMPKWIPALDENSKPMSVIYIFPIDLLLNSKIEKENLNVNSVLDNNNLEYCDEEGYWYFRIRIDGNKIIIESYPGENNSNYSNKNNPREIIKGEYINGEIRVPKTIDSHGTNEGFSSTTYKITNDVFYQANYEDSYNEYFRCD